MIIRFEIQEDIPRVRLVNELAFNRPDEADLVDKLRQACPQALSLVADLNGLIVGHILVTPAVVETGADQIQGMSLGPVAVLPGYQNQGIGSALIQHTLDLLKRNQCLFVIVLGHSAYYPRFGFETASRHGIRCPWEGVPDEAFMVIILDQSGMQGITGVARYRDEFNQVT